MTGPLVWHMVGTNCSPEKELEFNEWYSTHHAPIVLRGPAIAVERYQRIGDEQNYPKYLAIYEYENEKALNDFMKSPLREEVLQDVRNSWPKAAGSSTWLKAEDFIPVWSVSYKRIAKRGNGGNPLIIAICGTNCPPDVTDAEFNEWYTNDHMVFVLRSPYVVRAERFQRIGDEEAYPKYLAIYRWENERTLEESGKNFLSGLSFTDRRRHWPDWVFRRPWLVNYKLISKERKDLVV